MNSNNNKKILMITGDKNLFIQDTSPHERLEIQKKYADITPVFWGRGALLAPFKESGVFDIVTVQDPFWRGLVGLYISIYKRARFNVQLHTDLSSQSLLRKIIARIVLRYADSIRVVSSKLKTQVENLGVSASVKVLPIFLDIDRFIAISKDKTSTDKKTILWIGRFEEEKDPSLAIKTFKEVCEKGVDAELIMLGSGSLENKLRRESKGLRVTFHGWSDPLEYLAKADVLLNTSHYEGYGATIVEALASRTPVVSLDVGVAREAGATIATYDEFTNKVVETLNSNALSNTRAELKIQILSKEDWGTEWSKTLL